MDTEKISDEDLLQVIRYYLKQFKAGEAKRFDLEQAGVLIKELTRSVDRSLAH